MNHNFVEARHIIQKVLHRDLFIVLTFLVYLSQTANSSITAYLTVILVNQKFKGLRHVMSTHVLIFRLLQPSQIPNSSHHLLFLPVYGTTLCMIN